MRLVTGFFMAWGNFCAIPCPHKVWDEKARKHMLVAFPLVGLVIGLLWLLLWGLCGGFGISAAITAVLITAYPFMVSGFIHLDGFMDCNDAILSRRPLEQRQKILKDSHVGAFAVIAAILLFLAFFSAMWTLGDGGQGLLIVFVIVIPVLSRGAAAIQVLACKPLSTSQYDASFDPSENKRFILGIIMIMVLVWGGATALTGYLSNDYGQALLFFGRNGIVLLIVSALAGAHGRSQLGGMSGDISGYSVVYSELAAVLAMTIIIG